MNSRTTPSTLDALLDALDRAPDGSPVSPLLPGAVPETEGFTLRFYAPHARRAFAVGEFCDWQEGIELHQNDRSGLWEAVCPTAQKDQLYKLRVLLPDGRICYEGDPLAHAVEQGGQAASRLWRPSHPWRDGSWLSWRRRLAENGWQSAPIHIYRPCLNELFGHAPLSPQTAATELASYAKQLGYTHVMLPWLSGPTLAPDPALATPDGLCRAVDVLHEAGLGVISEPFVPMGETVEARAIALVCAAVYGIEQLHLDGLFLDTATDTELPDDLYPRLISLLGRRFNDVLLLTPSTDAPTERLSLWVGGSPSESADEACVAVFDPFAAPSDDGAEQLRERYAQHMRRPGKKLTDVSRPPAERHLRASLDDGVLRAMSDLNHAYLRCARMLKHDTCYL